MKKCILAGVLLAVAVAQLSALELSRFVLTRDIKHNEPADTDVVFFLVEGAVYCFTEFKNVKKITRVAHRWYCGERLVGTVALTVRPASRWRTWSRKLFKGCTGQWKVQVLDAGEHILAEKKFQVTPL